MSALDAMLSQFDAATIERMAGQLGASPEQTRSAIQAALPMLMGAMQRNAATPEGAESLHRAVTRDHQGVDLGGLLGGLLGGSGGAGLGGMLGGAGGAGGAGSGGLGDLVGAVFGAMGGGQPQAQQQTAPRSPIEDGIAILGHVFGGQQPRAEAGVARASGLDSGTVARLMAMLAPMLMGALGKATQQQGLDAGGLGSMLGQDVKRMGGQSAGGLQQILGSVLDKDGDGDVDASDLLAAGSGLLGQFMRR